MPIIERKTERFSMFNKDNKLSLKHEKNTTNEHMEIRVDDVDETARQKEEQSDVFSSLDRTKKDSDFG